MIRQLLLVTWFVGVSSSAYAAQVCLDRDEFAGLVQRVEQTHKELDNIKAQLSLYKKANEARKEEIRVKDELQLVTDEMQSIFERLNAAHDQREAEHEKELANVKWWRDIGWSTVMAVTVAAIVLGIMK